MKGNTRSLDDGSYGVSDYLILRSPLTLNPGAWVVAVCRKPRSQFRRKACEAASSITGTQVAMGAFRVSGLGSRGKV